MNWNINQETLLGTWMKEKIYGYCYKAIFVLGSLIILYCLTGSFLFSAMNSNNQRILPVELYFGQVD